jgi:hypothetical protein
MNEREILNEELQELQPIPIRRLERVNGFFSLGFWFLRIYIVIMLILVVIGFARGSI